MQNINNKIIERALNVVKTNPEWITYIKNFNGENGFLFTESKLLDEIRNAIDDENPIHSGASLSMCLKQCKNILNNT
jgi:hypothetical protein